MGCGGGRRLSRDDEGLTHDAVAGSARGWTRAAVALAAFGAHGLKGKVAPEMLETWKTAAHFHLVQSVALLALAKGAAASAAPTTAFKLMAAGTAVFSGSLYLLVLTDVKKLGAITPIGGVLMIMGWLALVLE